MKSKESIKFELSKEQMQRDSRLFSTLVIVFILSASLSLSGCIGTEERIQTPTIPNIIISVDSYSPPAYRDNSTLVTLAISGINVTKGTGSSLNYKTQIWHTDGSWEENPESVHLTTEQKPLVFQRTVRAGEQPEKLYSNLTINVDKKAADGEYYITVSGKDKGLAFGSAVLSFKIGKGGKLPLPKKNVWNIGYTRDQPPPLSEEEKAEALAIVTDASYLKDKRYEITGVGLSFREFENFSGFFPVVTVNIRDKERPIAIMSYIIDLEEKNVIESSGIPLRPVPIEAPSYFIGQSFSESFGIFTKNWDAENFAGFWRDAETGASTETLVINQSILNSSYRVIEKHNLIYTTKPAPLTYLVYAQANKTPPNTNGFYSSIGWLGEKYTLLQGNRLAKIIYEQNASDVKIIRTGDSWNFGDEYRLFTHGITAPLEREAWIKFLKDNNVLDEKVLPDRNLYSYPAELNDGIPVFVTYISSIYKSPVGSDKAEFKYTWLRSHNIVEIKESDVFGVMEIISVKNGTIELRNKNPIDLSPGNIVHLMGDISIQVESSETGLIFHPIKWRNLNV